MKSILLVLMATICVVSPLSVTAEIPVLLRTFNNPAPEAGDYFGRGMAALGNDRVLIGAPNYIGNPTPPTNAAAVHLFHTNGTLLATFTNPPAVGGEFGNAIATLGNDRVVIGSWYGTSVCLFTTNGALVTTITDPQSQSLGPAVVAFGTDKLLIGAPDANYDPETWDTYGAAYLYSTNGTRLMTFNNPSPGTVSGLGSSVATFGSDRVLIGAGGDWTGRGAAYLFHTNGTRLMTFTNPAPHVNDYFGRSIAAVGTDRILIGSPAEGTSAEEVYLFNTNGTLLLTITNPAPAADDWFGHRIAVLGNDRVVIGAPDDDTTGLSSGSAYVFSLNSGTLLATINNPAPGIGDRFSLRLVAFGNDGVIIGAPGDNGVGSAYLFRFPAPAVAPLLIIQPTFPNTVVVSWPSPSAGFELQQNTDLAGPNWTTPPETVTDDGMTKSISISPTPGQRFFRLLKP